MALVIGAPAGAAGPPVIGAAPPESLKVEGRTIGLKRGGRFDAPRWVMIRSAILPGWGQVSNRSWIKALAVAGGEGALGYNMLQDLRELDRLNAKVNEARVAHDAEAELLAVTAYNDRQSLLVQREWLLGGLVVYAMVDAYVDAHFRHFDFEFKHDPALPQGVPVKPQLRLSYRWSF